MDSHRFKSQNQARLHYSRMLGRYKQGQTVTEADRVDLEDLLKCHPRHDATRRIDHITVTPTGFKRSCFSAVRPDQSTQRLSFISCIRNSPRPDQTSLGCEQKN